MPKRQFVETVVMHYPDGRSEPSAVIWNGKVLVIDEIISRELNTADFGPYDYGVLYTVRIRSRITHLYKSGSRFYVMLKDKKS